MVAHALSAIPPRLERARICSSLCLFVAACYSDLLPIGVVTEGGRDPERDLLSPPNDKQTRR